MSSSNARIVLKRGSAVLFGSLSYRQQPRLALRSFSRIIPDRNSSNSSRFVSKEEMQKEHNFSSQRETEKRRVDIDKMFSGAHAENEKLNIEIIEFRNAIREGTSLLLTDFRQLNAEIEAATDQVTKCLVGTIVFIFGAGLVCARAYICR